ncbi:MAG TPA: hypothetical protein VKQ70_14170, partial [Caulobacteraceae bacterium]|nr:hypothetical protein [Caulobacteraceae bacterium]
MSETSQTDVAGADQASWAAQWEAAQRLAAAGRSRDAVAPLKRALELNPRIGVAWRLLADIDLISGDLLEAQRNYDRMLCVVVPDPRLWAASTAMAVGRLEEADAALRTL